MKLYYVNIQDYDGLVYCETVYASSAQEAIDAVIHSCDPFCSIWAELVF